MKAKVYVSLKRGVLDPQGKTVQNALHHLEFRDVTDVRIGKYIELSLATNKRAEAEKQVAAMCEKLLANTVIESYRFEIE